MTTEDGIRVLKHPVLKWSMEWDERDDGLSYYDAIELAISALRSQQETRENEPLTLDELRTLNGEPVWVVELKTGISYWVLAGAIETGVVMVHFEGVEDFGAYVCYGKTWLAYRRKQN